MKILGSPVSLVENVKHSFKLYSIFWLILLVTIVLDSLTTIRFMTNDGIIHEANLIIRWLAFVLGIIPGVMIGKFLQFIAAIGFTALSLKHSRAILILLISLNLLAAYHNL